MILDHTSTNTQVKVDKLTKLFYNLEKLNYDQKNKDWRLKYFSLIWNLFFAGGIMGMGLFFVVKVSIIFAIQRVAELSLLYYMQSMMIWRNLFCNRMRCQLQGLNTKLKRINVVGGCSTNAHGLMDQLTIHHNLIMNWVDVYNALYGRAIFLVKIFETYYALVIMEMYLSHYLKSYNLEDQTVWLICAMTFAVLVSA